MKLIKKTISVIALMSLFLALENIVYAQSAQKLSDQEVQKLVNQANGLLNANKPDEAVRIFGEILRSRPDDRRALYGMACACSIKGDKKSAIEYLQKAVAAGYDAIHEMARDPKLAPLRDEPVYKDILARKDEIQKQGARRRMAAFAKDKEKDDILELDEELKIIWLVGRPRIVFEEIRKNLIEYQNAQLNTLFRHKRDYYIAVMVTYGDGGFYNHAQKFIGVPHDGLNLMHEFTHALHWADQDALGMDSPVWIEEGLASLFETSAVIDGIPTPLPNFRLNDMLKIIGTDRYVPWEKLFRFTQREFERNNGLINYAESRYIFYYFWQKGKLKQWYDAYCDSYAKDKTGTLATEKTFGKPLADVEADFKKWVATAPRGAGATPNGAPYLGVTFDSLGSLAGARVTKLVAGGPAEKAGLKERDIINRMDGVKYLNTDLLLKAIREKNVGDKVTLTVFRGNESLTVPVVLEAKK